MSKKLWTKNFTLIIMGTIISAIGGVGLNLALSVTVYDNTQSTWLTGLYGAITILPSVFLPVLVSPFIDRFSRRKIIYRSDYLMGFLFLIFSWLTSLSGFNYYFYLMIGVIISFNGIVYQLAYNSLFPNLIPEGMLQKGYAIGNIIYPLSNVFVLPLATLILKNFGVSWLFFIEGILLILAATCEKSIKLHERNKTISLNLQNHFKDIKEGFAYLLREKGIWNVYLFFFIMMYVDSLRILIYPFFEQADHLDLVHYSLLLSLQSAGYMFGGFLHYHIKIPTQLRYVISLVVYLTFALLDAIFFLVPLAAMIVIKFTLGILGMNSANIRVTSINAYIDDDKRGRLNAVFTTMVSLAMLLGKVITGWLGEHLSFVTIAILYACLNVLGVFIFILVPKRDVQSLYNREV